MVYVLQFQKPLGSNAPRGQARFYVGYCEDCRFDVRLKEHRSGRGAAITAAAVRVGIRFEPVLLFPGQGRDFERAVKRRKNTPKFVKRCRKTSFDFPMVVCNPFGGASC